MKLYIKSLVAAASIAACSVASAGTFTFTFSGIPSGGSLATSASATVITGQGTISVSLSSTLSNPNDVSQLISDFQFSVAGVNTVFSGMSYTGSGTEVSVVNNNTKATGGFTTGASAVAFSDWSLTSPSAGVLYLNDLNGGQPAHLILGPSNAGDYTTTTGAYANANGSIAGNGPHNPFLENGATFSITGLSGVTASSVITNPIFSFGTTPGSTSNIPPGTPGVPDGGATVTLVGLALVGLGAFRRFGKR